MKDSLEICTKCNSDAAYVTPLNSTHNQYYCFGCGFSTSDFMKQDEFDFEEYESTIPELYKDIKFIDAEKRVWYPITINIQDKGTVFIHGTNVDDWEWAGVKVKEISEEEKGKFKIPGTEDFYAYKTDMKTLKKFPRKDFIEGLDYINFFEE